jgi:hypothetical protein
VKRLHLVTEGHGDVEAAPELAMRVLVHLHRQGRWCVTKRSSRLPKGQLVDERTGAAKVEGIEKAIAFASSQRADALLVLVDGDDHCPATFGPSASQQLAQRLPASAVMVVREFETWLALAHTDVPLRKAEAKRNAKELLRTKQPDYKPTVHQTPLAKAVVVEQLLARGSTSFDKFCRELDRLTR